MANDVLDVLVVGGGPVGLTLACELLRHGVRCRIVDKNAAPQIWSKAAGVATRTLEVLRMMGIVDRALAKGRPVYGARIRKGTETIASLEFRAGSSQTPYPYLFGLSQRDMELMLAERLVELGGKLERPCELVELQPQEDRVLATLAHPDGQRETLSARHVIGCDGARSFVRQVLELPFEGSTFEQTLMQADLRVEFPFEVDSNEAQMFISPDGPAGFLPLHQDGRYRMILVGVTDPPAEPPLAMFEEIVAQRCPPGTRVHDPAWTVSFRFHGRIVPSYRRGRVFLVGDAGHIHSPVGGQGMNLGMQDAFNLGWKLALVLRGAARPEILDSYDAERHPIGKAIVDTTDAATKRVMRMMTMRSPLAVHLRNQLVGLLANTGFVQELLFRAISGVDVEYPKSPIVGEHHSSIWSAEIGPGRDEERPGLGDWLRFSKGPGPGERVGEFDFGSGESTLFDLLTGTRHKLFLFDGAAATTSGYENLSRIAQRVQQRYGEWIETFVVLPSLERPAELTWEGRVLQDPEHAMHEHFGCSSEGLYLIRPDGYVGFRSQPAYEPALMKYLESFFTAS